MHQKKWLVVILVLLSLLQAAIAAEDRWVVAEGTEGGRSIVLSFSQIAASPEIRNRNPILLKVQWGYQDSETGMPSEPDIVLGRALEDGLLKIIGAEGIHVMTRTGNGGRTWFFYVKSIEKLRDPIAKFFDAQEPVTIRVLIANDRNWNVLTNVRENREIPAR